MAFLPDGTPLPGKLFIVEGIDGSGKSTQLDLLHKWLVSEGYAVVFSEWNSSPIVRRTTKKGKKEMSLTPLSFHLIHAADFAHRIDRHILPALKAGAIVLADRYIYTAFARDGARGMDPEYIRKVYSFAVKPTIAFYFKVPLKESLQRIMAGRPRLKYYEAGMDLGLDPDPYQSFKIFQGRIKDLYDQMEEEFGLTVVDATLPLVEQQQMVREMVEPLLQGALKVDRVGWSHALTEGNLQGRYLDEMRGVS